MKHDDDPIRRQRRNMVHEEADHKKGDFDGGNGTNLYTYGGSEGPDSMDYHTPAAGVIPYTFEEANPRLQYTRPEPETCPVPVEIHLAPTAVTRSFTLTTPMAQPVMLLAKNPRRVKAQLCTPSNGYTIIDHGDGTFTISTGTGSALAFIGNDPAGLVAGQGMAISSVWCEWGSYGELYVIAAGIGTVTVTVVEYSSI